MANIYERTDRVEEANKLYKDLISEVPPIQSKVQELGRFFLGLGKYDLSLETYEKGKKTIKSAYKFNLELAEIYAIIKKPDLMINEYLNLLEYSAGYIRTVQTYLAHRINFEEDKATVEILRVELLKRVQSNPKKYFYNEMLIWYYIQLKSYLGAVNQSKALDIKTKSDGKYSYKIGNICKSNKNYEKARLAYKYIIDLGQSSNYYSLASQKNLEVSFLEVTENNNYSNTEIKEISEDFEEELTRLGYNSETLPIVHQLSKIYAFYLNNPSKAESLLKKVIAQTPNPKEKAELKLLLGDVLVSDNKIWDASLLYMQITNQFKEDKIGHLAKFKNAKVFYYDGEFDYAKAQLDVLKASTSKLIANDAMRLSLIIQDNLGIDTTEAPLFLYAKADLLIQQHQYNKAIITLDSINSGYPFHSLSDEVLFQKGLIYAELKNWDKAIFFYSELIEKYGFDILADDAIFNIAEIYDYQLNSPEKAAEYYKKILFEHSSSLYTALSRERFRALKNV